MTIALDVAGGLMLMYLVLSLFCTTINEVISNALSLRAGTLRDALAQLIDNPELKKLFYNHGLIDGAKVAATAGGTAPTAAAAANDDTSFDHVNHPSYLPGRDVAMALIDSVVYMDTKDLNLEPNVAAFRAAVAKLPDSNIRDALMSCAAQSGTDLVMLRDEVAAWFDTAMDRLSEIYTRYMRIISVCVGLVIALGFNADTIQVAASLWNDPVRSATLSESASKFVASPAATQPCRGTGALQCQIATISALNADLRPYPIGWSSIPGNAMDWLYKIAGILATTIALTLGAPFWFDLLQQFVNIRGSGSKPDKGPVR